MGCVLILLLMVVVAVLSMVATAALFAFQDETQRRKEADWLEWRNLLDDD